MTNPNRIQTTFHNPSVAEGRERLEHYQQHGATPYSFWFSQHFPQPADESVCA